MPRYNHSGPDALTFRHTGGHPPPLSAPAISGLDREIREALSIAATPPQKREPKPSKPRWTLKRLVKWLWSLPLQSRTGQVLSL